MENGRDFLRAQVRDAVTLHKAFLDSLEDNARQASDARLRQLCNAHLAERQKHQAKLEAYQRTLGGETGGAAKKVLATIASVGKDLLDATPQDDYPRLLADIERARVAEHTFKTFRDAGRELGEMELAWIGEEGERGIDRYVEAANRLLQKLFVELAQEVPVGVRRVGVRLRRTDAEEFLEARRAVNSEAQ
jgi:ferritin-like metal-binding protein YciE